jgi:hypothetical protein
VLPTKLVACINSYNKDVSDKNFALLLSDPPEFDRDEDDID